MSKWNAWIITQKGQALEAKANAGKCTINFKELAAGDGTPVDLEKATELANKRIIMPITNIAVKSETVCRVDASLDNSELGEELTISELGIYAIDPDEGKILYGIATDNEPDKLQAPGGAAAYQQTIRLNIVVSNSANVKVVVDPGAFVSFEALNDAVAELNTDVSEKVDNARTELIGFINKETAETAEKLANLVEDKFANQYQQVTKLNTVALKGVYIPVKATANFCRPPLEVLKLRDDGISSTITQCDFTDGDAADFNENNSIKFDRGSAELQDSYQVNMTKPAEFAAGFISVTDEIDLSKFRDVIEVKLA